MYSNCSEIPIFNFFELVKTRDLSLLLEKGEKIEDYNEDDLSEAMANIITEYNELTENKRLMQEYQQKLEIEYLEARYNITKNLISIYHNTMEIDVLVVLKDFNWSLDLTKEIKPQLKRILNSLKGLKNKINIKKINFVKKFGKKYENSTPNFDLTRSIINLEIGIPLSFRIDIHRDSIKDYIYWSKSLEEKNKAIKRNV